jgi:hypothetical protein
MMTNDLVRILTLGLLSFVTACGGTLDAGYDLEPESLPVGRDNPIILANDGPEDNWHGEYAVLLAHAGGPPLAGIIVSTGGVWGDLEANLGGWQDLVQRARASGLANVPDPVSSPAETLKRPSDGEIDATVPNDSTGARFIVDTSLRLSRPDRPVVVVTGGRLTDIADAYLIDPTVTERVVVVSSLGTGISEDEPQAHLGVPNGEMDSWASAIVVQRFRYVQVSAYYSQVADIPAERLAELPDNPFCDRIRAKQPEIAANRLAADQVSVLALGLAGFARDVTRVAFAGFEVDEPLLAPDPRGTAWLVGSANATAVSAGIWRILLDPRTFED